MPNEQTVAAEYIVVSLVPVVRVHPLPAMSYAVAEAGAPERLVQGELRIETGGAVKYALVVALVFHQVIVRSRVCGH
jgi:hypothetical protein